ncbi:MAG: Group 1 glycosyl transferase [Candidatus Woesebacteria bacterium GW2011_GWB1_38_8]|uniref:Group 1 glycosyl transferase n=1 Tax=Candidatus Woesebacteria bacterium GW2011_GWB1_38_8 TaxID=1618570 RepID=A0A0G0NIH7_9BACT|nr:MAG: Group 1 glycosyl transferase [Candidatus Woesebacteria bacterium GW2011_GWB1_38_8]
MIIGIDGNEANIKEKVGVHQYAFELLWTLYRYGINNKKASLLQDIKNSDHKFIIYLKNHVSMDLPPQNSFWEYRIIPGSKVWVLAKLMPALLKEKNIDVFFTPTHYLPLFAKKPMVCTIHDLGYLKFSEQFKKYDFWQLKYWSAISIIVSKYIICPSDSTRSDIVRRYPFAAKKVRVVQHGYDKSKFNQNISQNLVRQVTEKYRIKKNYLLFLSTLKPSKNVEGLIDAFVKIKNVSNHQLVIAGKKGWLYDKIFLRAKDLKVENDIIFTDYVSEKEKRGLLKGATAYVLPSFWEGFGMDVLDALACGTPVVVSKAGSLPEVAGDAGIYIDPYNIDSLAQGMEKVLKMSEDERSEIIKKGLNQAQKFSWEKSARETLKVLEEANKQQI